MSDIFVANLCSIFIKLISLLCFNVNPDPASTFFVPKMLSAYYICCKVSNVFKTTFIMKSITMNPDQTAPLEQSDLGSYCLQYRPPKFISR